MELKFECVEDALKLAIKSSNKALKEVASEMWPTLTPDQALVKLTNSLNIKKRDRLKFEEMIFISNSIEVYYALEHIALCCGFEIKPMKPQATITHLQEQLDDLMNRVGHISSVLASIKTP